MSIPPKTVASLLVVDDSAVQRAHTVAQCRALGIDLVYEAAGGQDALDLLALLVLPPSVIVVDLEMPGMDGVELIQQMHQRGIRLPLIVASSREESLLHSVETMARALGMPVLDALRKPLTPERLGAALAECDAAAGTHPARERAAETDFGAGDLAYAIERGEIVPHYQPKVDIRTGIVRGVEVLARWRHPVAGMIAPGRFIPVAEREGLIRDLTLSILDQALAQAAAWSAQGFTPSVAINFSARLFETRDLVGEVVSRIDSRGLPAGQLVLEVTESAVVTHLAAALGTLARLRLKGLGLSIDDYGTGFSSMQQLARIPFTELKIDRSFVHDAHRRPHLRVILQSALDMAGRLGLSSVAEGIETMEDWRLLQELGCDVGQGYLIARPMPADELPAWRKSHGRRLAGLRAGAVPQAA